MFQRLSSDKRSRFLPDMTQSEVDIFWSRVKKSSGCWEWIAGKMGAGYGECHIGKYGIYLAHRISYKLHTNIDPKGFCILHKCDNRSCVNPDHLFLGSDLDNKIDATAKRRVPYGENHWRTTLKNSDIMEIRRMYLLGGITHEVLADKYKVCRQTIGNICNEKTWKYIRGE